MTGPKIRFRGEQRNPEQAQAMRRQLEDMRKSRDVGDEKGPLIEEEKTERDIKIIALAERLVREHCRAFGVDLPSIGPDRISFVPKDEYVDRFNEGTDGMIFIAEQRIVVRRLDDEERETYFPPWDERDLRDEAQWRSAEESPALWRAFAAEREAEDQVEQATVTVLREPQDESEWQARNADGLFEDVQPVPREVPPAKRAVHEDIERCKTLLMAERREQNEAAENLHYLRVVVHEIMHAAGAQQIGAVDGKARSLRSGYDMTANEGFECLESFNEAVVETMSEEVLLKAVRDRAEDWKELGMERVDEYGIRNGDSYTYDRLLLQKIIDILAKARGQSPDDAWALTKRQYFAGGLMHLRAIEKIVGPGALAMYAKVRPKKLAEKSKYFNAVSDCLSGVPQKEYARLMGKLHLYHDKGKSSRQKSA